MPLSDKPPRNIQGFVLTAVFKLSKCLLAIPKYLSILKQQLLFSTPVPKMYKLFSTVEITDSFVSNSSKSCLHLFPIKKIPELPPCNWELIIGGYQHNAKFGVFQRSISLCVSLDLWHRYSCSSSFPGTGREVCTKCHDKF